MPTKNMSIEVKNSPTSTKTATGVAEWANKSLNIQKGCEHNCIYCYAKQQLVRVNHVKREDWENPVILNDKIKENYRLNEHYVMFPTSHDITPRNIDDVMNLLHRYLAPGNKMLIVTKPHYDCMERMTKELSEFKNQIEFRLTIGSTDDSILKFWEPGTASIGERIESLKLAYKKGYNTSISSEPMLDGDPYSIYKQTEKYRTGDHWFGLLNSRTKGIISINTGCKQTKHHAALEKLRIIQNDDFIIALYNHFKDNPKVKWKDEVSKRLFHLGIFAAA